jgi:hypothetical protein
MKNMKKLTCLLAVALMASVASAQDAEKKSAVKIVKETKIFALDKLRTIDENSGLHSMQLSPDGKTLLYARRLPRANVQERLRYHLVLRDIKAGTDTVMPGDPLESNDFLVACTSMRPFDATGKKIVIPVGTNQDGKPGRLGKGQMQPGIYDIATGKLDKLDMKAPIILPSYDATGKNLIVFAMFPGKRGSDMEWCKTIVSPVNKIKFRKIGVAGLPRTPCPIGDILPILLPPERKIPDAPRQSELVIYDTKADKKLTSPPLTSGRKLDDYNPQWTTDGRYLYYVDREMYKTPDGNTRRKQIMRVWDRKKSIEQSLTEDHIPIGPAPEKAGMIVLDNKNYSYSLHDPATGKTTPLALKKSRIISVSGRFMVYVKKDKTGTNSVYRAEIK